MKAKFRTERTFEDTQNFSKNPRPEDIVDVLNLPDGEWVTARAVGPVVAVGGHWVNIEPPKKDKKTKAFPVPCLAFDPKTEERDSTKSCPWCSDTSGWVRNALDYWQNFIVRGLEDNKPANEKEHTKKEKKTGFKEKSSKSWTPCRALRISPGFMRDLKKQSSLNRHLSKKTGQKKAFPLSHEKYGVDLELQYNKDEAPAKKYTVVKSEKRSPLTEGQQEYLLQPVEKLSKVIEITAKAEDAGENTEKALAAELKKQQAEYADWMKRQKKKWKGEFTGDGESESEESDDDEDEDRPKGKGKKGKKSSSKSRSSDDDEDEDSSDDDDDNEFDSDKKSKKSKKSKTSDDDEDDEDEDSDDEDEDDEDEDDEPKSKKSKKSKKGKKSRRDEDEEDEEDEDD